MSDVIDRIRRTFRVPNVGRKTHKLPAFVPVIFANGRDDDLPGIAAAIRNEAVQYQEKIYAVGEALTIDRQDLFISTSIVVCTETATEVDVPPGWALIVEGNPARHVAITNCMIYVGTPKP